MHSIFSQRVFSVYLSISLFMNGIPQPPMDLTKIDVPTEIVETVAVSDDVVKESEEEIVVTEPVEPVEPEPAYFVDVVDGYITEESLKSICKYVGDMYDISPELLQAMAWVESRYEVRAISRCNAKGLCQIIQKWHGPRMERLGVTDIYDPYGNVLLCADTLDELSRHKYGDDIRYVLMAYNRGQYGEKGANSLYQKGIITEYVTDVLDKEQEFKSSNLVK